MNKDEIKQQYSMRDIVEKYGFRPNIAHFIKCPFHSGDNTASMKIYKDSYHCFGCGANGDIFSFIQGMESCDFKTAFMSLGGTYEKPTFESKLALYRAKKNAELREIQALKEEQQRQLNNLLITIYRSYMGRSEPLSDVWCDCFNALQYQLYLHEIINEKR